MLRLIFSWNGPEINGHVQRLGTRQAGTITSGALSKAMKKILVSACLMGHAVRYDGGSKPLVHPAIGRWRAEGRLVTICPEMSAGMPVPRPPSEIEGGVDGTAVLAGRARVVEATGGDVTTEFRQAAENTLRLAGETGCGYALLIDGSPSCGSGFIYDGSFSGTQRGGQGVTAALLKQAGIEVYSDREIERLIERLAAD
jgi:uncharacterized protein YbbK (DUF523 family)